MNPRLRENISFLSTDLDVGDTKRVLCPFCKGGSSEEESFSVTRTEDNAILYKCFRASCGMEGIHLEGGLRSIPKTPRRPTHKRWEGETTDIPPAVEQWIFEKWHMDVPPAWFWTADMGGRIAMSIRTPQDTHRGWVLRSALDRPVRTKAYTYFDQPNVPKASWYRQRIEGPTILVEDIPSAVRVSQYYNACALLGTGVTPATAEEIAERRTGQVIIALDADATIEAIRLANKWRLLWGDVFVLVLQKDFKDKTEEEICATLKRIPS